MENTESNTTKNTESNNKEIPWYLNIVNRITLIKNKYVRTTLDKFICEGANFPSKLFLLIEDSKIRYNLKYDNGGEWENPSSVDFIIYSNKHEDEKNYRNILIEFNIKYEDYLQKEFKIINNCFISYFDMDTAGWNGVKITYDVNFM